ncbi:MAG TPA: hypothetical protein VH161_08825, partial [Candidatus Acidoferrales bacterium]|nr:hypothetical protein [Candidatus Acidoferrales bacterium]
FAAVLLAIVATLSFRNSSTSAQDFPAVIGRIEGDDLEVATTTPAGIERDASPTVVASGSEVTLRSGRALLLLNAGGEISICGPAHFKLLKSSGAVTLALDYGRVHPSLETSEAFTIYTPTIVATPIAISGGYRDLTVGLEQSGEMCVLTARGAMRVEPQFSEQSLIVPQGGTVSLSGGQIDSLKADPAACACDFPRAHMEAPKPVPTVPAHAQPPMDVGALAPPIEPKPRRTQNIAPPSSPAGEPVYTVLMPPLSFDASSPEPPPAPAPETILLVREVRLRPSVEFRGHVNPAPAPPIAQPEPAPAPPPAPVEQPRPPQPSFFERVRNFLRRFTSESLSPCAGAGCNG